MKAVDLFAGCGGLTLGLQNAGFKVVGAADNWEPAIRIYRKNFDHEIIDLDLSDVQTSIKKLGKFDFDMLVGGPPCQDFSHAGKRNEDNGRGDLTISFAEIVKSLKPKFFIMENVDRIVKTRKYEEALEIFKHAGYGLTVRILDASLCGVPQRRKRCFVVGELGGEDEKLGFYIDRNISETPTTVRDYLGDSLQTEYYYRHPRNYMRRAIYSLDEPSPTVRGVNRPIPKGYPGHSLDATDDLTKARPLTTIERSYIQTFPKEFVFEGSKSDMEQLIGNAVPVKLAEFVARALLDYIGNKVKDTKPQQLPLTVSY